MNSEQLLEKSQPFHEQTSNETPHDVFHRAKREIRKRSRRGSDENCSSRRVRFQAAATQAKNFLTDVKTINLN